MGRHPPLSAGAIAGSAAAAECGAGGRSAAGAAEQGLKAGAVLSGGARGPRPSR